MTAWEDAVAATAPALWWKFDEAEYTIDASYTMVVADVIDGHDAHVPVLGPGGKQFGYYSQFGYGGLAQGGSGGSMRMLKQVPPDNSTAPFTLQRENFDDDFDMESGTIAIAWQFQGIDVPYEGVVVESGSRSLMRHMTDAIRVPAYGNVSVHGHPSTYPISRMKDGRPHLIIYSWRGPDDSPAGSSGREWLYIDNALVYDMGEDMVGLTYRGQDNEFTVGPLPGGYDDFLLWDGAILSTTQIRTLWNAWRANIAVGITGDVRMLQEQLSRLDGEITLTGDLTDISQEQTLRVTGQHRAPYLGHVHMLQDQRSSMFGVLSGAGTAPDGGGSILPGDTTVSSGSPDVSGPDILSDNDTGTYVDIAFGQGVQIDIPALALEGPNHRFYIHVLAQMLILPGYTATQKLSVWAGEQFHHEPIVVDSRLKWVSVQVLPADVMVPDLQAGDGILYIDGQTIAPFRIFEVRFSDEVLLEVDLDADPPPAPTPVQSADQVLNVAVRRPL